MPMVLPFGGNYIWLHLWLHPHRRCGKPSFLGAFQGIPGVRTPDRAVKRSFLQTWSCGGGFFRCNAYLQGFVDSQGIPILLFAYRLPYKRPVRTMFILAVTTVTFSMMLTMVSARYIGGVFQVTVQKVFYSLISISRNTTVQFNACF